jgi:hypothetical protein
VLLKTTAVGVRPNSIKATFCVPIWRHRLEVPPTRCEGRFSASPWILLA